MPYNIALIACDNGLGHVRRMMSLSIALSKLGARPILFAPEKAVKKLADSNSIKLPEFVDFYCNISADRWREGNVIGWIKSIPSLENFDGVICDNLVEILEIRPDAFLSGTFLWHRSILNCHQGVFKQSESLLEQHNPRVLASDLFVPDYFFQLMRVHSVGLYSLNNFDNNTIKNDILISCGKCGESEKETYDFIRTIASEAQPNFIVWVEPDLVDFDLPVWMKRADFSPKMFSQLAAAIIRPGIGTTTDALLAGARVFSFYEDGNDEMSSNSNKIENAGLGLDCKTHVKCWNEALCYREDFDQQLNHNFVISKLDRNGADSAAKIIIDSIN